MKKQLSDCALVYTCRRPVLAQIEEFIDSQPCGPDESSQGAGCKFRVLGYGEVRSDARLRQHLMAPDLTTHLPAGLLEGFRRFFARNVREPAHETTSHHLIAHVRAFMDAVFAGKRASLECGKRGKIDRILTQQLQAGLRPPEVLRRPSRSSAQSHAVIASLMLANASCSVFP